MSEKGEKDDVVIEEDDNASASSNSSSSSSSEEEEELEKVKRRKTNSTDSKRFKKRVGDNSVSDACIQKIIVRSVPPCRKSPPLIQRVREEINRFLTRILEETLRQRPAQSHTIDVPHVTEAMKQCGYGHIPWQECVDKKEL